MSTSPKAGPGAVSHDVGVLRQREIEARIVAPLLAAFAKELGEERAFTIAREVIVELAHEHGTALAGMLGGCTLDHFESSLPAWTKDGALHLRVIQRDDEHFDFDVTQCRFAEMYRAMGIERLGALLSCNRDRALIDGFNPDIELTRTQTILEGATHCDFRLRKKAKEK